MSETLTLDTTMQPATRPTTPRKLFVNIPVRDLAKSMNFFGALGFQYHPGFTDHTAASMLVGEDAYFMLLSEDRFRGFSKRPIPDTRTTTGAMFALSAASREEVDDMVSKAFAAGASTAGEAIDMGFMYGRSFLDLDGHYWEVFWMDPKAADGAPHE